MFTNVFRGDCSVEEKSKIKPIKWSFMKKEKCSVKGVMDGAPITQEGICQVYQLINFLSQKESMYNLFYILIRFLSTYFKHDIF